MGRRPPDDDSIDAPLDSWEGAGSGSIDPGLLRRHSDVGEIIARERGSKEKRRLERQMAQAENLATLGRRTADVAHELNNPLTTITVYGEELLRAARLEGRDAKDVERLSRIVEAAERMLGLSHELIDSVRPASEEHEDVSATVLIERALGSCAHLAAEEGVRISTSIAEALPLLRVSPDQMHQVLINLITNACHAAPAEGGRVSLSARSTVDGEVEITVSDNGEGVAPDLRASIFSPFFTTKPQGQGTGLGLPIVRSFVERHEGSITLDDREGGACFVLRLPGLRRR